VGGPMLHAHRTMTIVQASSRTFLVDPGGRHDLATLLCYFVDEEEQQVEPLVSPPLPLPDAAEERAGRALGESATSWRRSNVRKSRSA
jgi:hypothetical protein